MFVITADGRNKKKYFGGGVYNVCSIITFSKFRLSACNFLCRVLLCFLGYIFLFGWRPCKAQSLFVPLCGQVDNISYLCEEHRVVSHHNGLIPFLIGQGDHKVGDKGAVVWETANIRTDVKIQGEAILSDRKRASAAPFAYYAERIPLQVIEEHLGSTSLVTQSALEDSLQHNSVLNKYLWQHYQNYLGQFKT